MQPNKTEVQVASKDGHHRIAGDQSSDELKSTVSEKKLLRRLDLRIVPILLMIYLLNFLDRTNISNAMTLGLQSDLKLQGNQINAALAVFYVTYICFEMPSNLLLKRLKPHVWLSACVFLCGIIVLVHGFVRNYAGLITVRLLLGLTEAGVFPGCSYLISTWYKREEMIRRFVIFFTAATLSGAFGSLLASAIQQMDGVAKIAGWRWIFIIEGIATCLFAIVTFFATPDFPEDAQWLNLEERQLVVERLIEDRPESEMTIKEGLKNVFTDWKNFFGGLVSLGIMLPAYSTAYFLPTIISGFHYSKTQTQLHAVAPFAVGLCWSVGLAFLSTKINHRLILILITLALGLSGLGILFHVHTVKVMYAATFLFCMGVWGAVPLVFCWLFMNLRGHIERAIGTAFFISFGNLGGIASTYAFVKTDAPYYYKGYSLCTFGFCLTGASGVAYAICCRIANRSRPATSQLVDR